ncbi:MAG: DUF1552 domain-containing protein [Planctomycetaceae bacterium]
MANPPPSPRRAVAARRLDRRAVLRGMAGSALALPLLEAMGEEAAAAPPRRFCAVYTANGMALPRPELGIDEWYWFPRTGPDGRLLLGKSTEPLAPFLERMSFFGGLSHGNGPKADSHICSDMWLTGAPLQAPKPGTFNSVSLDQTVALHTKRHCRQPSLVLSIDPGVGFMSRTSTLSYDQEGKPIPAENDPRRVFDRLFSAGEGPVASRRAAARRRMSLVDAVLGEAGAFTAGLGSTDRETMEQYLASLRDLEGRLEAADRWLDVPLAAPDKAALDLEATVDGDPARYYRTMFDLVSLAFAADITRSVTFMLSREDGMGISDTFPLKLGLGATHHNLSHAGDRDGLLAFARYDRFLAEQLAFFLGRLADHGEHGASVLDHTLVLYGSGCSTTHWPRDLPTLVAGGGRLGLAHGRAVRGEDGRMANLYLSILRALGIPQESFADSTGTLGDPVFG